MSVYMDVEACIDVDIVVRALEQFDEDDVRSVIRQLSDEARAEIVKALEGRDIRVMSRLKVDWDELDRALTRRDLVALEGILWPIIRARWPRPKLTKIEGATR